MDGLRAATPGADEPLLPKELTMAETENKARERGVEGLAMMDVPRAPSKAAVASNLPQLPARPPRMISYENQVLAPDWLMKHDLATKRAADLGQRP
ncbi:hypothetical protein AX14_006146 [Amanita brunnescens Koide BX004]|nr:hypothetical protein AX14_006146 [Amanita brunnescens Koide BX004]